MKTNKLLKEMFDLFIMVQIKGIPYALSSYRTRMVEISERILKHYRLPEGKGFERIFLDLSGLIELPDDLLQTTRRKLEDCSHAYLAGKMDGFDHYLQYKPGLTPADFPAIQPDTYPRPIISDEVFQYVQNRLPFPLSEDEIVDIENGFVLRWNFSEDQLVGDGDFKLAVENYLARINRTYDQKIIWRVVDLMLEYLQRIGQWKPQTRKPIDFRKRQDVVIHFSFLLAIKYPDFMTSLSDCLMNNYIRYHFLSETKDIWCRDYMPVQVKDNTFIQFTYEPDYLKKGWDHLKTDPWKVTMNLPIELRRSNLVIDGGNVVRKGQTAVLTDKIYSDNPSFKGKKQDLIRQISEELEVEKAVIIPHEPGDIYGHSDGMVRFISDDTVIINNYLEEDGNSKTFITKLKKSLQIQGISIAGTLPYHALPRNKAKKYAKQNQSYKDTDPAIGCYINYLELENLIIFPQFGINEDQQALKEIRDYFPNKKIIPLNCTEIAEEGGVLNCISWECKMT